MEKEMRTPAKDLLRQFARTELPPQLTGEVQEWIVGDRHPEEKEEELRQLWNEAGVKEAPKHMLESVRKMRGGIGFDSRERRRISWRLNILRVAAALLLGVTTFSLWQLSRRRAETDLIESFIPVAQMSRLTLPDGTQVLLNSKSTLLYPKEFTGKTRSVYLIGEADFSVHKDKKHPFIVKTEDMRVTALGTKFNVSAYPENKDLTATLLEGSVLVEFDHLSSSVILKPSEQLSFDKLTRKSNLKVPRIEDVTAWQRGELVFDNMKVEDILANIERKFPYMFVYSPETFSDKTYSFHFRSGASLEEVLEIIGQVTGDLSYSLRGDKCYIRMK